MAPASHQFLWGWTPPVRAVLIVLLGFGAVGLLSVSPKGDEAILAPAPLVVDPNTARPEVLVALPKLGPALVARIVEAREQAPFQTVDELNGRVRGIGPATLESLRPYLRIESNVTEGDSSSTPSESGEDR